MIAEQQKLKAQYEKEKAVIEAEKELEVSKLAAQAAVAKAEGNAEAALAIATAEARAIKLKSVEIARMLGFSINETKPMTPWNMISTSPANPLRKSASFPIILSISNISRAGTASFPQRSSPMARRR